MLRAAVADQRARVDCSLLAWCIHGWERLPFNAMLKMDIMLYIDSRAVRAWPRRILLDSRASRVKRKETESLLVQSERRKMMSVA